MNKFKLTFTSLMACLAVPVLAVVWTETEDSTASKRKVTDGNFVVGWDGTGGSAWRLYYVSHDASVGTVLDMTTLCSDMEAAEIKYPNTVNGSGFANKSGITRIVFPEEIIYFHQNAFSSMSDLESVVISSKTTWSPSSNPKQCFSSCTSLSMITPRGVAETNGVVYLPEGCTAIPNNMFQFCNDAPIKHVIAPWVVSIKEAAFYPMSKLETITVSPDIHTIGGNYPISDCASLTKIIAGDNSFRKLSSLDGSQVFKNCKNFSMPLNFSKSTFTSIPYRCFWGTTDKVPEIRLPATLTYVGKNAFRMNDNIMQNLFYFYGKPPTFECDEDNIFGKHGCSSSTHPRRIVFIKAEYKTEWLTMFGDKLAPITDADKARDDYPTKSEVVKVVGANVLGVSTYESRYCPYYVCTFVEPNMPLSIIIR